MNHGEAQGYDALATVARARGIDVRAAEIRRLSAPPAEGVDLAELLIAAHRIGLQAVPLEGEYADLFELELPSVAVLRGERDTPCFVALTAVGEAEVEVRDPDSGAPQVLSAAQFRARWTGDVLHLSPDPSRLKEIAAEIALLRDPWARLRRRLGLTPPWGRPLRVLALGVVVVGGLAWRASPVALCAGLCLLGAAWAWAFGDRCRACGQAAALVGGLPVAQAGVAGSATLFAASALGLEAVAGLGLAVAAGLHLALLAQLGRARLACGVCLGTGAGALAGAAWAAALAPAWGIGLSAGGAIALVAALALGAAGLASRLLQISRAIWPLRKADGAQRIARQALLGRARPAPGTVEILAMTRPGCARCAWLRAVAIPGLEAELGERLRVAPLQMSALPADLPLLVIRGSVDLWLAAPPDYAAVQRAVGLALDPGLAPLGCLGPIAA